MRDKNGHIEIERFENGCGAPLREVIIAVAVFYILATLLNAETLLKNARLKEYGRSRDVCIAVIEPVARFSRLIHFNAPRQWIERAFKGESTPNENSM